MVEKTAGVFIDGYNDKVNTSIDDHIYNSYPDMDQGTKDRLKEAYQKEDPDEARAEVAKIIQERKTSDDINETNRIVKNLERKLEEQGVESAQREKAIKEFIERKDGQNDGFDEKAW